MFFLIQSLLLFTMLRSFHFQLVDCFYHERYLIFSCIQYSNCPVSLIVSKINTCCGFSSPKLDLRDVLELVNCHLNFQNHLILKLYPLFSLCPLAGFSLGSTVQSHTKGIQMWCVPHPKKPDHTLVLLDTEGLGDVEKVRNEVPVWTKPSCLNVLYTFNFPLNKTFV